MASPILSERTGTPTETACDPCFVYSTARRPLRWAPQCPHTRTERATSGKSDAQLTCPTRSFGRGIEQLSQCFVPTFGRDTASYLVSNWVFCLILPSTSMGGPGMPREAQGWPGMHREAQGRPGRLREAQRGPRLPMEAHGGPGWQGETHGGSGMPRETQGAQGCPGRPREAQESPG